jgi:tRNA-modifying protein YgfZ
VPTSLALTQFDIFPALSIGLFKLTGQDNKKFLQGQLTCDLDRLTARHSILGAHCDPKGKMLAVVRLLQYQDDVYALQAANNVETHLPQFKKYAAFSKVEITNASDEFVFTGFSGQQASQWLAKHTQLPSGDTDTVTTPFGLLTSFPRAIEKQPRYLLISTEQQATSLLEKLPSQIAHQSGELWNALDIISATPQIMPSNQAEYVPQMLNLQMIDGISFSKGCYIGQETVARMHYRGLNKRAMFVLRAPSHINARPGDSLERQVGTGWRNAGTIVNAQVIEQQTVALAILPTDSENDSQLRLKDSDEAFTLSLPDYFQFEP